MQLTIITLAQQKTTNGPLITYNFAYEYRERTS